MNFHLHPQLKQDCLNVGRFELCRLLLMNDCQFPWFILVPEITEITEIYHLALHQRSQLLEESCFLAEKLAKLYEADKMNIAAIGNSVPQLHIHHVIRYKNDKAWPAPVWGKFSPEPYQDQALEETLTKVRESLLPQLK